MPHVRHQAVQAHAQGKEGEIGVLAANVVRERRPEEPPADVEQAQQAGEAGGDRRNLRQLGAVQLTEAQPVAQQLAGEHFLQQGRSHAEDADTGRHVQAQHQPDQRELRGLPGHADVYVAVGDHGIASFLHWGAPAFWLPAGGRYAIRQGTGGHEHEVDRRHDDEALPHAHFLRIAEMAHQRGGQRCTDHGPATEAHDRHAGGHAALVREPLDQGRNRRDVAQAQADTTDYAGTQPHQPQLVGFHANR